MTDFRIIPSIEQLRQRQAVRALEAEFGREAIVEALRAAAADLRAALAGAREESGASMPADAEAAALAIERAARQALSAAVAAVAQAHDQRHRRRDPHESRARPALGGRHRAARRAGRVVFEPRVRPRDRAARPPGPSRRGAAPAAARCRGRGRGQQQRRGDAPDAGGPRRGPRGDRLARGAGGNRRRLPRPRRDGAIGREAARGRHDEPHAHRRLPRRDRPRHGAAAQGAPVELQDRGIHRAADARGTRAARDASAGSRSPRTSAAAISASSGKTTPGGSTRCWPASRACRRASRPASTSCASAATSCSADRRPASSPGGATWCRRSGGIR